MPEFEALRAKLLAHLAASKDGTAIHTIILTLLAGMPADTSDKPTPQEDSNGK